MPSIFLFVLSFYIWSFHVNSASQSTHHLRFSSNLKAYRTFHADFNKLNIWEIG